MTSTGTGPLEEEIATIAGKVALAVQELTTLSPYPRPVAGAVVVNARRQVLLVYSGYAGQGWHFPKGGVDEGESPLECAIREAAEEVGITAVPVPDSRAFELGLGKGEFSEPLAWGSPRRGRSDGKINLGTAHLLREAAQRAGMPPEDFERFKYPLFDRLSKQEKIVVRWRSEKVYFALAYTGEAPEKKDGESEQIAWLDLGQVRAFPNPYPDVRKLLSLEGFEAVINRAARIAAAPTSETS